MLGGVGGRSALWERRARGPGGVKEGRGEGVINLVFTSWLYPLEQEGNFDSSWWLSARGSSSD